MAAVPEGVESAAAPMIIYIDADACPVKQEVYRVAERHGLSVVLVANSSMAIPKAPWIELVLVDKRGDAADDWIVERVAPGDVVVTQDILLAERCLKERGARPIAPNGKAFTAANIGEALARRELMERLRQWGGQEGGPAPFTKGDRSRFLQTLHETIVQLQRDQGARF